MSVKSVALHIFWQLVFGACLLLPNIAAAQESIALYEVNLTPNTDGTFVVREVITYNFGRDFRHGIFRTFDQTHPQESSSWLKRRVIDIEVKAVTLDGVAVPYEQLVVGNTLQLKIGDPLKTITGEHQYKIEYVVNGGYFYHEDQPAELYWNAIGTEWGVEIDRAILRIDGAHSVLTENGTCYLGQAGNTTTCAPPLLANTMYLYEIPPLAEGEGVTVAYALTDKVERQVVEQLQIGWLVLATALLVVIGLAYKAYRYKTEFSADRSVVAQYEPPVGLKPMYVGVLFDDRLSPQDITACIVYLAEQGYVSIKKTSKKVLFLFAVDDYELTLSKVPDHSVSAFQQAVLELLFGTSFRAGESVTLSDLRTSQSKQRANQRILQSLRTDLKQDLIDEGYIHSLSIQRFVPVIGLVVVVFIALYFGPAILSLLPTDLTGYLDELVFVYVTIAASLLLVATVIALAYVWRRRTKKGYEALWHLRGFKEFLSTTEKDRYAFHNAPEKSPTQFMEFLPYAIAFGVEKEWAEVFKDITIPDPGWYDGGSSSSFSATNLTTSLGAFSTAFASSSGSSGSASSGGGSVGGGAGGGGGGSW